MSVDQRERRIVADGADVAKVIGNAFEFGHDAAQDGGAWRRLNPERWLPTARENAKLARPLSPPIPRHDACCLARPASVSKASTPLCT